MSDPGAIARNVRMNAEALERARARNNSSNYPAQPPSSVTGVDMVPSQAVNGTRNPIEGGE
jgi:hypothetical protein